MFLNQKLIRFGTSTAKLSQKQFLWSKLFDPITQEVKPITIYSTNSSHVKTWQSYNDRAYKGMSSCQVEIIKTESTENIVFKGELKYNEDIVKSNQSMKGTFCACKGSFSSVLDLRDYEGFSLTVKSFDKDAFFTFNMYCESQFERDLYQIPLQIPKDKWFTFHIPFHLFK